MRISRSLCCFSMRALSMAAVFLAPREREEDLPEEAVLVPAEADDLEDLVREALPEVFLRRFALVFDLDPVFFPDAFFLVVCAIFILH